MDQERINNDEEDDDVSASDEMASDRDLAGKLKRDTGQDVHVSTNIQKDREITII
jgi:hypothetical protein